MRQKQVINLFSTIYFYTFFVPQFHIILIKVELMLKKESKKYKYHVQHFPYEIYNICVKFLMFNIIWIWELIDFTEYKDLQSTSVRLCQGVLKLV